MTYLQTSICLFSCFFVLVFHDLHGQYWKEYQYEKYNCEVQFYSEPEFFEQTFPYADTSVKQMTWKNKVKDTNHDNLSYILGVCDYPSNIIHSDSSAQRVTRFLNSTQGDFSLSDFDILSSVFTEKHGYPGKIFNWKTKSGEIYIEFHVYLVGSTLYHLSVVTRPTKNDNKFIDKFTDSFELINIPEGTYSLPGKGYEKTYTIKFPGIPRLESKVLETQFGNLRLNIQLEEYQGESENFIYVASEVEYPNAVIKAYDVDSLNHFYSNYINRSINAGGGELVSVEDVFYNDYPGKYYKYFINDKQSLAVYKIYFINNVLYSIGVITLPENDNNKAMTKFIKSFKIKK